MPAAGSEAPSEGSQTKRSTLVSRATPARAASARPESVQRMRAPEFRRMKAISGGFSMKLMGTSTAPARATAKRSATNACEFRASTATRSPAATPRRMSARASASQRASSSA